MTFLKKVLSSALVFILIVCALPLSNAYAADAIDDPETIVIVEDLGDDVKVETTIQIFNATRNTSTSAVASSRFTRSDVWIGTVTLKAFFTYNGMTAGVTGTEYATNIASGWSYTNHKITTTTLSTSSGGTATLTATLKNFPVNVPVNISLHCSPSGIITTN